MNRGKRQQWPPTRNAPGFKQGEKLILYSPLKLPGDSDERQERYLRSYLLVTQWEQEMRETETQSKTRDLRRKKKATSKATGVFLEVIEKMQRGEVFDLEKAADEVRNVGLSSQEIVDLGELLKNAMNGTLPAHLTVEEIRRKKSEIRLLRQRWNFVSRTNLGVRQLEKAARELGDAEAAKALHHIAQHACAMLGFVAKGRPDLLKEIAGNSGCWPVIWDPQDVEASMALMQSIGLGANRIEARFRPERAFRETTPARAYARTLVEMMWSNRVLVALFRRWIGAIRWKSDEYLIDFEFPVEWLKTIAKLPAFSASSVRQWASAAREVLRAECPDFHLREEWSGVRRSFGAKDRGRIQNKILDRIGSAMLTIAKEDAAPSKPPIPRI